MSNVDPRRHLRLEGGRNFRDLGGYETRDGRRVRWGKLYRSGYLAKLTDADYAWLAELGVRVVCDFRTAHERRREPTQWRGSEATHRAWDYDSSNVTMRSYVDESQPLTADIARLAMHKLNRRMPFFFAPQYRDMFEHIASGDLPLLFHCAVGKDRTGIAAAITLKLLGVPDETIAADYALTDACVDLERELFGHRVSGHFGVGEKTSLYEMVGPEVRAPLLSAKPEYIAATLDQIERECGSFDAYAATHLGITPERATLIRERLLEN